MSSPPPTSIWRLPPEVRTAVYEELFSPCNNATTASSSPPSYRFHLALLQTCRRIHGEALPVLRRLLTFVVISTPWPEAPGYVASKGRVPLYRDASRSSGFDGHRYHVDIDSPDLDLLGVRSAQTGFVILLEDLHLFCEVWKDANVSQPRLNRYLRLTLERRDPHGGEGFRSAASDRAQQARVLRCLEAVKYLGEVRLSGFDDNEEVEKQLREVMKVGEKEDSSSSSSSDGEDGGPEDDGNSSSDPLEFYTDSDESDGSDEVGQSQHSDVNIPWMEGGSSHGS